jgi:sucrose-phosphate synthase
MRHPQWQTDTPEDEVAAEESSLNDSLMDVQDMSLRLSIDGDKPSLNGSLDYSAAATGDPTVSDQVQRVLNKIKKPEPRPVFSESGKPEAVVSKHPMLRRRRRLIVIALDCYDSNGVPEKKMIKIVQDIIKAVRSDSLFAKVAGLALSTAMSLTETTEFLTSSKIQVNDFDALICSSGGEVYYPGTYTEEDGKLARDPDYAAHIDYRWGCDGLRKTIWKLMNTTEGGKKSDESSSPIEEDKKSSNAHCIAYLVKDRSKVIKIFNATVEGLRSSFLYIILSICSIFTLVCFCRSREWMI